VAAERRMRGNKKLHIKRLAIDEITGKVTQGHRNSDIR